MNAVASQKADCNCPFYPISRFQPFWATMCGQWTKLEPTGFMWMWMDGRFVPNITIGPLIVEALRPVTQKPLDVHLMIVEPERYVADFAKAGADHISVHAETSSTSHLHRVLGQIKELGKQAGVVLNPGTPLTQIEHVLDLCDIVLIMSGQPWFWRSELHSWGVAQDSPTASNVR